MKNATEPKGLSRRVLALVTALLLTLSLLPGSFAVSAEETANARIKEQIAFISDIVYSSTSR